MSGPSLVKCIHGLSAPPPCDTCAANAAARRGVNDGGAAFPLAVHGAVADCQVVELGMSRRFYVAARVMAAFYVSTGVAIYEQVSPEQVRRDWARIAWLAADALIAAESERAP